MCSKRYFNGKLGSQTDEQMIILRHKENVHKKKKKITRKQKNYQNNKAQRVGGNDLAGRGWKARRR